MKKGPHPVDRRSPSPPRQPGRKLLASGLFAACVLTVGVAAGAPTGDVDTPDAPKGVQAQQEGVGAALESPVVTSTTAVVSTTTAAPAAPSTTAAAPVGEESTTDVAEAPVEPATEPEAAPAIEEPAPAPAPAPSGSVEDAIYSYFPD
ncbi:MAG: hypothetical protein ACRD0U_01370, partial [Acidimicrobiales bacterium]